MIKEAIKPDHYRDGGIETIDFIDAKKLNFNLGNTVKYISRAGKKDPEKYKEDLQKGRLVSRSGDKEI